MLSVEMVDIYDIFILVVSRHIAATLIIAIWSVLAQLRGIVLFLPLSYFYPFLDAALFVITCLK